jgi:hypothetical protein
MKNERTSKSEKRGWQPPQVFVAELDKFIRHNLDNPEKRIGSIQITAWLARNGITAHKDAVYRWMLNRNKVQK